jgi:hypothetical protein
MNIVLSQVTHIQYACSCLGLPDTSNSIGRRQHDDYLAVAGLRLGLSVLSFHLNTLAESLSLYQERPLSQRGLKLPPHCQGLHEDVQAESPLAASCQVPDQTGSRARAGARAAPGSQWPNSLGD